MDNASWYAMFVKTGDEDHVKERARFRLKDQFNVYVPKRKLRELKNRIWYNKVRILFPGYVILNGDMNAENYYKKASEVQAARN